MRQIATTGDSPGQVRTGEVRRGQARSAEDRQGLGSFCKKDKNWLRSVISEGQAATVRDSRGQGTPVSSFRKSHVPKIRLSSDDVQRFLDSFKLSAEPNDGGG